MICKPVQLPDDIFHGLMHLPDPTPSSDGHYKPFAEIFGKETSENHQPSLQKKPKKKRRLFHSMVCILQHVKNANMMLECKECGIWHLLYVKNKLSVGERTALQHVVDKWSFTCDAQLQDLNLTGRLADVYVKEMSHKTSLPHTQKVCTLALFPNQLLITCKAERQRVGCEQGCMHTSCKLDIL